MSPCAEVRPEMEIYRSFENAQTKNFASISYNIFTLYLDCQRKIVRWESKLIIVCFGGRLRIKADVMTGRMQSFS